MRKQFSWKNRMKKIITLLLSLILTLSVINTTCMHTHDDTCGYDQYTQTGCTHECDDECLGIDPYIGLGPDGGHV